MDKRLSLFFLLLATTVNSTAQSITQLAKTADSLLKNEAYEGSLKVRNKILTQISPKQTELYAQQKYKQQFTEAQLAATTAIAVDKAKISLNFFNQLKDKPITEQINLYNLLYHSLAYNNQREEALAVALKSYKNIQDKTGYNGDKKIDLIYDIGFLYSEIENYFEAINYYKKSLSLYVKAHGEVNENVALNYNNLAYAYRRVYNQKYTIAYYRKAALIWEKVYASSADEKDNLIMVYQNLIAELLWYGALDEAKAVNLKLNLSFYKKYGNKSKRSLPSYFGARKLMVMGNVRTLAASGNFLAAKQYCDSLRNETKFSIENKKDIAFLVNCYTFIGDYTYDKKDYAQTIKLSNLAGIDADKYELKQQKMIINAKLGTTYEKLKDYKQALYHISLAAENANQQSFNSSKFSIQIIKSQILQGQGLDQQALILAKNSIAQILFEKTGKKVDIKNADINSIRDLASEGFINIFVTAGHISLKSYQKTSKKQELADAQKLFILSAQLFQEYYLKGEFNETLEYYNQRIVEGLLSSLSLKKASISEKVNTINLLERMASQHLIKEYDKKVNRSNAGIRNYIDQMNDLKSELDYYKNTADKEKATIAFHKSKIESIKKEIDLLTKKIASIEKNYVAFNSDAFNLIDVQQTLKDNKQILKYYVTENAIFSVLIDENSVDIKRTDLGSEFQAQINEFINQTKSVSSNFKSNASNLYQLLLPKGLNQQVVIIPDNFLNYVPFETLFDQNSKQYLVQQKVIAYDYSLPLFLLHQKGSKSYFIPNLAAFSPDYSGLSDDVRATGFKKLKFAGVEAAAIANLFGGDLFGGTKATKNSFVEQMEHYGIFHLSMHSQLYEDDFNQSFLLFANNQKLYFSELYGMNIPAYMVVLSACNTGNGLLRKGEGIMSMSRALTYAGVRSAVVSLWQVPDKETSEIMVSFYQNLKEGQTKSVALANAKMKFIKDNPMKNHPFYWAGFIVNGDISPLYHSNIWVYVGLGIVTLLLILWLVFRKRLFKIGK